MSQIDSKGVRDSAQRMEMSNFFVEGYRRYVLKRLAIFIVVVFVLGALIVFSVFDNWPPIVKIALGVVTALVIVAVTTSGRLDSRNLKSVRRQVDEHFRGAAAETLQKAALLLESRASKGIKGEDQAEGLSWEILKALAEGVSLEAIKMILSGFEGLKIEYIEVFERVPKSNGGAYKSLQLFEFPVAKLILYYPVAGLERKEQYSVVIWKLK